MKILELCLLVSILMRQFSNSGTDILSCNSYEGCKCNGSVLACNFINTNITLPCFVSLPESTDTVLMEGKNFSLDISDKLYDHSWSSIKRLEIMGSRNNLELPLNFTKNLVTLKILRIRNSNLTTIQRFAFANMKAIEEIDLSNNSFLHITEVEHGLENFSSNTLRIFNISSIHNAEDMLQFTITEKLFNPLESIIVLDISWTRAFLIHASFDLMPALVSLNISGTLILGPTQCFSTLNRLHHLESIALDYWPTLSRNGDIPVLDYSSHSNFIKRETLRCPPTPYLENTTGCVILPQRLKYLYMRYVHSNSFFLSIEKGFCLESNIIEFFSVRRMKIFQTVSALFGFHKLKVFDMAYIGYHFKTNLLWDMPALETFISPGNNIKEIENDPQFGKIFSRSGNLKGLDLSENELSVLPNEMFLHNPFLEVLDLSKNVLQYISLNLSECVHLRKFFLNNNLLKTIDWILLSHLDSLISDENQNIQLDIQENEFICICSNIEFVKWVHITNITIDNKYNLTCKDLESKATNLIKLDIIKMKNICFPMTENPGTKPVSTVVILVAFVFIVVTAILTIVVCLFRRHKLCFKKKIPQPVVSEGLGQTTANLQEVQTSEAHENFVMVERSPACKTSRNPKYTVFLAYCHEDRNFVTDKLYSPLESYLRRLLPGKNEDTLTLLYDKNFLPGENLVEICRAAVYQSYVTVAIVSDNFLRSRWCSYEMTVAFEADVPVIPLFLTKCRKEDLSGILKYIYEHKVRLLWPENTLNTKSVSGEEMELIECLANSIVTYVKQHDSDLQCV